MANAVFTTAATVECPHHSKVSVLSSSSKLTVNGKPVMMSANIADASLDGTCTQTTNTNTGQIVCSKVLSVSATTSTRLTVGSAFVVTATLAGLTDGAPQNAVDGSAGQALLTAA